MPSAEDISELPRHPGFGSFDEGNEKDALDAENKAKALIKEALELCPGYRDDGFSREKMNEARSRANQFDGYQENWTPNRGLPGDMGRSACSSEQGLDDHSEHRKTKESDR